LAVDPDQGHADLWRFYSADAIGCARRVVINCSDFDTQPKNTSASTSETS